MFLGPTLIVKEDVQVSKQKIDLVEERAADLFIQFEEQRNHGFTSSFTETVWWKEKVRAQIGFSDVVAIDNREGSDA